MSRGIPSPIELRVVGMSFRENYPDFVWKMAPRIPARVTLKRRPNNQSDPNAISVHWNKLFIGYIGANMAKRLAPELDAGIKWRAWATAIVEHPDHPDNPGVLLTANRVDS